MEMEELQTTQVDISSKIIWKIRRYCCARRRFSRKKSTSCKIEIKKELNTKLQEAIAHKQQAIEKQKIYLEI